jgi:DNA modification methylase
MRMLDDNSVNLIVIDPPYNIGKDARWDKWRTVDEYVAFMGEVFTECERVLAPNGSFYWFHNDMPQIRKLMDAVDSETSFVFKQLITWNKIDPTFRNYGYAQQRLSIDMMRNYYNGFTEYCVYYTFDFESPDRGFRIGEKDMYGELKDYFRGEREKCEAEGINIDDIVPHTSNFHYFANGASFNLPSEKNYVKLQMTGYFKRDYKELKERYNTYQQDYTLLRQSYEDERYTFNTARVKDDLRANSNVWLYPPAQNLGHITPKPVPLIENIIAHSSNEGDVVLDCFGGSGTTAVACANLNRKFILIEREPEYCAIAERRVEDARNALTA